MPRIVRSRPSFGHIASSYIFSILISCGLLFSLSACSSVPKGEAKYPTSENRQASDDIYKKPDSVMGDEGLKSLFGGKHDNDEGSGGSNALGVNSFLWRASLDTVSFMPVASADPFGGTILTDWYSPPSKPDERFKLNVFILDRQLRSDGVQVKAFHQVLTRGVWKDAPVSDHMAGDLEDTILTRARQMRVAQMQAGH